MAEIEVPCLECGEMIGLERGDRIPSYCGLGCAGAANGRKRVKREDRECRGCGEKFSVRPSEKKIYCSQACVPRQGEANGHWKGGVSSYNGRKLKVLPDGSQRLYSRWVMEQELGRKLDYNEVVHHVNGDPTDDRIENLQVVSRAEHMNIHRADLNAGRGKAAA